MERARAAAQRPRGVEVDLRPRRSHPSDEDRADGLPFPFEDPTSEARADLLAEVFALTGGQEPNDDNAHIYRERLSSIVDLFVNEFNDWKDWYKVAQKLATDTTRSCRRKRLRCRCACRRWSPSTASSRWSSTRSCRRLPTRCRRR